MEPAQTQFAALRLPADGGSGCLDPNIFLMTNSAAIRSAISVFWSRKALKQHKWLELFSAWQLWNKKHCLRSCVRKRRCGCWCNLQHLQAAVLEQFEVVFLLIRGKFFGRNLGISSPLFQMLHQNIKIDVGHGFRAHVEELFEY